MSRESIRSQIHREEAQITANNTSIRSLTERCRELEKLRVKLVASEKEFYQKIRTEKKNASTMRSNYRNIKFMSLYSTTLIDGLTGTESSRAKNGMTQSILEVEKKKEQLQNQIDYLREENRRRKNVISNLYDELRRLEEEEDGV